MKKTMRAVVFDEELKLLEDYPVPNLEKGEALVRVNLVGICNTDYEITKGYMGYKGVLGHEFVGVVEDVNSDDKSLIGKRVVAEISKGCGQCEWCARSLERHCPNRKTIGIWHKDGCFSQYAAIPISTLFEVPDTVTDEEAVFVEPLAAALEITEQLHIKPFEKVAVLGDGKLGLLIALALRSVGADVSLIGKHNNKLNVAAQQNVKTLLLNETEFSPQYDIVVEATGSASGFETALSLVKPRGVLVLKSTIAVGKEMNLAPIVINEITVLGSRCGQFSPAIRLLQSKRINFSPLITEIFDSAKALQAFERNKDKDSIKVLIRF